MARRLRRWQSLSGHVLLGLLLAFDHVVALRLVQQHAAVVAGVDEARADSLQRDQPVAHVHAMIGLGRRLTFCVHVFLRPAAHLLLPLVALMRVHWLHHLMLLRDEHLPSRCLLVEAR